MVVHFVPEYSAGAAGITLSYQTDTDIPAVSATDQVVAFAKAKNGELKIARKVRGSQSSGTILIPFQGIVSTDVECCYLFVLNEDGSNASDSTYVVVG